jgi:cob(I)alamin adenosyltransferase
VAVPEAFLTDRVGECLRRYLDELGVEVIPVATAALSRLRDRADLFVLPIFGSVRKGREELQQVVQQLHERVQMDLDKLPRVVHFSIDGGREAVFEAFARIGLTFTRRLERLRAAFEKAVDAALVPTPQSVGSSEPVAS